VRKVRLLRIRDSPCSRQPPPAPKSRRHSDVSTLAALAPQPVPGGGPPGRLPGLSSATVGPSITAGSAHMHPRVHRPLPRPDLSSNPAAPGAAPACCLAGPSHRPVTSLLSNRPDQPFGRRPRVRMSCEPFGVLDAEVLELDPAPACPSLGCNLQDNSHDLRVVSHRWRNPPASGGRGWVRATQPSGTGSSADRRPSSRSVSPRCWQRRHRGCSTSLENIAEAVLPSVRWLTPRSWTGHTLHSLTRRDVTSSSPFATVTRISLTWQHRCRCPSRACHATSECSSPPGWFDGRSVAVNTGSRSCPAGCFGRSDGSASRRRAGPLVPTSSKRNSDASDHPDERGATYDGGRTASAAALADVVFDKWVNPEAFAE
jgi:hypothetical protein